MKNIQTEIIINASKAIVWQALMNFKQYPEWNPFIKITGEAKVGSQLENTIFLEGKKPQVFKPIVLELKKNQIFRWEGHLFIKGLFDGEHYFLLERIEEEKTKLIHGENFRGLLSSPILKMIEKQTVKGFKKMNQALKERAERIEATLKTPIQNS